MSKELEEQYDQEWIEEILSTMKQVLCSAPAPVLMSWGIEALKSKWYDGMLSLSFQVNGFKYKGEVILAYDEGADLYQLILPGDNHPRNLKRIKDLYFDQVVEAIDNYIEKGCSDDEYGKKVTGWLESEGVVVRKKPK